MTVTNWLAIIGMFITVLFSVIGGLMWVVARTTRFETILAIIQNDVSGLKVDVAAFTKNCFTTEDAAVKFADIKKEQTALWTRVDSCKKWIRHLFFKNNENLDDKDF